MPRSIKSNLLISQAIAWSGLTVAALIGTYGPHGPARRPRMMLVVVMLVSATSLVAMKSAKCSRTILASQIVLWIAAALTGFLLANTSLGDGVHPIATAATLALLGMVSVVILWNARIDDSFPKESTPDA